MKANAPPEPKEMTISTAELAGLCDLTERRIRKLTEAGIIQPLKPGRYPLKATFARLIAHYRASGALTAIRREELHERIRRLTFTNDTREGKFIELDVVKEWARATWTKEREILTRRLVIELPQKLEGLTAQEIRDRLDAVVGEVLDAMKQIQT
jgi:hypothetical protein